MKKKVTIFFWILMTYFKSSCQVYNYFPIEMRSFETVPSILAHPFFSRQASVSFLLSDTYTDRFNAYNLAVSNKFKDKIGYGLGVSTVKKDFVEYQYFSLNGAYLMKLTPKLNLSFGLSYKYLITNAFVGTFDYFSNSIISNGQEKGQWANASVTFANSNGSFYINNSILNFKIPIDNNKIIFPLYYVLQFGNVIKWFNPDKDWELNYVGFVKSIPGNSLTSNHYINFRNNFQLSEKTKLFFGIRVGCSNRNYIHFYPNIMVTYKNLINVNFGYNYHINFALDSEVLQSTVLIENTSYFSH